MAWETGALSLHGMGSRCLTAWLTLSGPLWQVVEVYTPPEYSLKSDATCHGHMTAEVWAQGTEGTSLFILMHIIESFYDIPRYNDATLNVVLSVCFIEIYLEGDGDGSYGAHRLDQLILIQEGDVHCTRHRGRHLKRRRGTQ